LASQSSSAPNVAHSTPATINTDVLVIGGGGAGLAAAIEAATAGRRVILLEKNPQLGGTTAWSVGSVSVTNSPHQQRAGISDSTQAHFEDLEIFCGAMANRDNRALRRLLVDNITDTFNWLCGMGLVFTGPMPEPPHRVPRMHNVLPNSRAYPDRMGRRARSLGVDIRLDTRVESLRVDGARIIGANARGAEERTFMFSAQSVVLAAGDYSASAELLAEYVSADAARLSAVNVTATGDGQRIGRDSGGQIVNADVIRGPAMRFVPPPSRPFIDALPAHPLLAHAMRVGFERLPRALLRPFMMRFLTTALGLSPELLNAGAILVNEHGMRFGDELDHPAQAMARQPHGRAYVVFDGAIASRFNEWPNFVSTAPGVAYAYLDDYRRTRADICHVADTLDALADQAGLDPVALRRTVHHYNADREARGSRPALDTPAFHVLGPVQAYVVFTDGGLMVNERLQVLDSNNAPITGLYAAGSNGQGGVILEGHGHHLGWAFVSGRIAGRNAALA
jgi:succinate dehydrogenase/fumarate reductase flavoprotein subunit